MFRSSCWLVQPGWVRQPSEERHRPPSFHLPQRISDHTLGFARRHLVGVSFVPCRSFSARPIPWFSIPGSQGSIQLAPNSSSLSVCDSLEASGFLSLKSTFARAYVDDFESPQSFRVRRVLFVSFLLTRDGTFSASVFTNKLLVLHSIRLPNIPHAPPLVSLGTGWQGRSTGFLLQVTDKLGRIGWQSLHFPWEYILLHPEPHGCHWTSLDEYRVAYEATFILEARTTHNRTSTRTKGGTQTDPTAEGSGCEANEGIGRRLAHNGRKETTSRHTNPKIQARPHEIIET